MLFLSELDVVNEMLATLGESPLNALSDDHPIVASCIRKLRITSTREQTKKWWFNTENITLTPDPVTGSVMLPADCLSLDPVSNRDYVQRGRRLYNRATGSYNFGTTSLTVRIAREVPYTDLPVSAADYIATSAILAFCRDYDADRQKVNDIKQSRAEAWAVFNAEHIRYSRVNILGRSSTLSRAYELSGENVSRLMTR